MQTMTDADKTSFIDHLNLIEYRYSFAIGVFLTAQEEATDDDLIGRATADLEFLTQNLAAFGDRLSTLTTTLQTTLAQMELKTHG